MEKVTETGGREAAAEEEEGRGGDNMSTIVLISTSTLADPQTRAVLHIRMEVDRTGTEGDTTWLRGNFFFDPQPNVSVPDVYVLL